MDERLVVMMVVMAQLWLGLGTVLEKAEDIQLLLRMRWYQLI